MLLAGEDDSITAVSIVGLAETIEVDSEEADVGNAVETILCDDDSSVVNEGVSVDGKKGVGSEVGENVGLSVVGGGGVVAGVAEIADTDWGSSSSSLSLSSASRSESNSSSSSLIAR